MKKYLLIAISIIFIGNCFGQAPGWWWANECYGNITPTYGGGICLDNAGWIYVAGDQGDYTISGQYGLLAKFNPNSGNEQWHIDIGNTMTDIYGMSSDNFGNIYVTGYTKPSSGIALFGTISIPHPSNSQSLFVAKFDSGGNALWAKVSPDGMDVVTNANSLGLSVLNDLNGNAIVLGEYNGDSIYFGTNVLPPSSGHMMIKYDSLGNVVFAQRIGDSYNTYPGGFTTDNIGNIYLSGTFNSDSITFGTTILTKPQTDTSNIFFVKYSPSGNVIWARSVGVGTSGLAGRLTLDPAGYLYFSGMYNGQSITFGTTTLLHNNYNQCFISKFDISGNAIWARNINNFLGGGGLLDATGNIYCYGSFSSPTFTFGTYTFNNSALGFNDLEVLKMDSSGNPIYAVNATGDDDDYAGGMLLDASGNIYVTGWSRSFAPMVFGGYTTNSFYEMFVAKLGSTVGIDEINNQQSTISISPNPFTSLTTITFNEEQKNTTIKITDVLGNTIQQSTINSKQYTIDMSGYAKGIYFVRIEDEKKNVLNRKMIKN